MSLFQCLPLERFAQVAERQSVQIVDIRNAEAFAANHIPGSKHLHNGNLAEFLNEVEFEQPLVVVCYHGISSQSAAQYLAEQGFEQVYSLDEGFEGWLKRQGIGK